MSNIFTKPRQTLFLDALEASGNVDDACDAANISWQVAYGHRQRDAAFRARWADLVADAFSKHVNGVALRARAGLQP